ncbi:MAG: aromatic ring-hydroxylating dioxygenase subunit alpha [Hyphomonadaceae bacterium]|nr:aromatic ring-hydroxylating dioxygenase subunit alpha [Hyphomonadaceae bacterium]
MRLRGDFEGLVDCRGGSIDRSIFWDREIYDAELQRIFARCWIFLAHESQIQNPGDFVTTYMGEDAVIVCRRKGGAIGAFLNSCTHRGNRVCLADYGNARRFVCNYHGWAFGLGGELLAVPEQQAYADERSLFDQTTLGLKAVAQVDSYKGLVFGTFDPNAPPLTEYLGAFTYYLDVLLDAEEGGTEVLGGCLKALMSCNWKLPAENFTGDAYHVQWTHQAGASAMISQRQFAYDLDRSYAANVNGHGSEFGLDGVANVAVLGHPEIVKYFRQRRATVAARLGELRAQMWGSVSSANVFPSLSFLSGVNTLRTWIPRGPHTTELRTWVIANKAMPDEIKELLRTATPRAFSPSGVLEMDDGENWELSTRAMAGVATRKERLHYGMGLHTRIDHPQLPGNVYQGQLSDANQLAFYQKWADLMSSPGPFERQDHMVAP